MIQPEGSMVISFSDGMMLGAGTMVDEYDLAVVGLERRVRVAEAAKVLDMSDAERTEWSQKNPALQSAVSIIFTCSSFMWLARTSRVIAA